MTTAMGDTTTTEGQGTAPATPETAPVETTPATPADPASGVQPTGTDATTQPDGGQGLIAPYLEGVDEAHRDVVTEILNRYRQDSDAQVTKRFEELNRFKQYAEDPTALEMPVALYENLMERPLETLQWVIDRFQTEAGLDLKSQLVAALNGATEETAPAEPTTDDPNRPLTVAEWQRLQQEQAAAAQAERESTQRRETVKGWLDEAATGKGLELGENDVALRQAILTHAAQLLPQFRHLGDEAGKSAIATAVEAIVNRFGTKPPANAGETTPEPTLADGGVPPAPSEPDLSDPKARKAWMLSRISAGSNTQE